MTDGCLQIGIMGGSFNPVHNGHIAIARTMLAQNVVDKVVLMVSPQNPLKHRDDLADEKVRYRLAQLACEGEKGIFASDFEFTLPRPSFTWNTLCALTAAYPQYTFKLLIGADNWAVFRQWYRAEDIIANYGIAVYPRRGYETDTNTLPRGVEYIEMPLLDISATNIRKLVKAREDVSALLPSCVLQEIHHRGLYI